MWRPDNWAEVVNAECYDGDCVYRELDTFEAGADAIVGVLIEKGALMTPEQMELLAPDRKYPYGWLVFIPKDA